MPTIQVAEPFQALFDPNHPGYNKTFKTFKGGRAGAKTTHIAQAFLIRGMQRKRKLLCGREYQNSIIDSVHAVFKEEIARMGVDASKFYTVQDNGIFGANGTEFLFMGLKQKFNSIKSIPGITDTWIEEGQTISERSLNVLIPTVLRTEDPWVVTSFNPDDEDDAVYKRFVTNFDPETDYLKHVNYDENPWLPAATLNEIERSKRTNTDEYNHIWLGETRKNGVGAIYSKWIEDMKTGNRICSVPYNPAFPVFTAWDLGFGDSTVIIFFQVIGREPCIIDVYAANQESLEHYVKVIKDKPYNYELHILPHDAGHASLRTGTTMKDQLGNMGVKDTEVLPVDAVETGIQLVRQLLPMLFIDAKQEVFIKAITKYQYTFDEDKKRFSNKPLHNWCSDYADALRYMATYLATRKSPIVKPDMKVYTYSQGGQSWMG